MLLVLLLTNDRRVMGQPVNSVGMNLLGGVTLIAIFGATIGLVVSFFG